MPDHLDSDDDNDGIIDADAGSGLSADIASALLGLNANYGNAFPVDQDVERHKPFNRNQVGRDFFSILGVDASYPLIHDLGLELKLYGQFALLLDDDALASFEAQQQGVSPGNRQATGFGIAAPGLWLALGPLNGQLEFRHSRRDFDSRYFDELYELDRAHLDLATGQAQSKDARLGHSSDLSGFFGRLGTETRLVRACLGLLSVPNRHQRPQTATHRQRIPVAQTAQTLPPPQARVRLFLQEQHRPGPQRGRHRQGRLLRAD